MDLPPLKCLQMIHLLASLLLKRHPLYPPLLIPGCLADGRPRYLAKEKVLLPQHRVSNGMCLRTPPPPPPSAPAGAANRVELPLLARQKKVR